MRYERLGLGFLIVRGSGTGGLNASKSPPDRQHAEDKEVKMASFQFDLPIYVQRKHFIEQIKNLYEAFEFLDEWPKYKRDISYETLQRACREAACGRFPLSATRQNLQRFVKRAGMLIEGEDMPSFVGSCNDRNIGNA
jgi:hypothetical protein